MGGPPAAATCRTAHTGEPQVGTVPRAPESHIPSESTGETIVHSILDRHQKSNGQGQGMNWIRPGKRLAIYLRDGLACAYCGQGIEDGIKLTLDHLTPHSHGGDNGPENLVTCCHHCNSVRGNRPWEQFAADVATYLDHEVLPTAIIVHINTTTQKPLAPYLREAKALIARRGGFLAALREA